MLESFSAQLGMITTITGSLMAMSYFLQAYQLFKRKCSNDLSLPFFMVIFVGTIIWLLYGISMNSLPLVLSNAIGLTGIITNIALYFKYIKKVEK